MPPVCRYAFTVVWMGPVTIVLPVVGSVPTTFASALPEPGLSIRVLAGHDAAEVFGSLHRLPALVLTFEPLNLITTFVAAGRLPAGLAPGSLASRSALMPAAFLPLLVVYLIFAV